LTPSSLTSVIYASPLGGATQYRFTLTDGATYNQTYSTPSRYFRLSNFNALEELTAGASYSVSVETLVHGFYYAGKNCNLVVHGGILIKPEVENNEEFIRTKLVAFKAIIHPNPFANSFNLDVKTASEEPITITIYDMSGRLLETKTFNVAESKEVQIGSNYPAGIYNAIVSQGKETNLIRIIKL
jgi:hypothetical protein